MRALTLSTNLIDECGSGGQLANEEHDDDSDESDGDADLVGSGALLAIAGRVGHQNAEFLALTHRLDEKRIEDDEQREWQQRERDAGEPVVNFLVDFVVAQTAVGHVQQRHVRHRVDQLHHGPLERRRQRCRETDQVDGGDDPPRPGLGAQHPPADRVTHGDVALHRERHRQPHRRIGCSQHTKQTHINLQIAN